MSYKKVTVYFPPEMHRELVWLKKYFGKQGWKDPDFIRWLIHRLYSDIQAKLLTETQSRYK